MYIRVGQKIKLNFVKYIHSILYNTRDIIHIYKNVLDLQ